MQPDGKSNRLKLLKRRALSFLAASAPLVIVLVIVLVYLLQSQPPSLCPGSPGEVIVIPRYKGVYEHYAVIVGNGHLVHFTGDKEDFLTCVKSFYGLLAGCEKAEVKMEKCSDAIKPGTKVLIESGPWNGMQPLPVETIVTTALSMVGTQGYHLRFNNCEHFARWCRYGIKTSEQVDNWHLKFMFVLGLLLGAAIMYTLYGRTRSAKHNLIVIVIVKGRQSIKWL